MSNNNLTDQIKEAQKWQISRYEIDKELLEKGYDAIEIDNAWQETEVKPFPHKKANLPRLLVIMFLWFTVFIILLAVFHVPAIVISSLNIIIIPLLRSLKDKKI